MTTWVALLRGVNVNGITIRSPALKELFRGLGYDDVRTVLASGNVRFGTDADTTARERLKSTIEAALRERFGYDAWILLVTAEELAKAIQGFPFEAEDAGRQPYVVFCRDEAVRDEIAEAAASLDAAVDPAASGPGVVYWSPPKGMSTDTPLARLLAKPRFKTSTTTRNLRTLIRIAG
ncbi:DUF1697 domain-containing protein [Microbacterium sp.]|uniref:DUF1697 domain-containing protein n=1 Tax=Microbacterium sp. TaxID=51671 RepID=UPI00092810AC|nr:DUF1697 domain-containing protein [Microbacterium sp.]MBN9186295.1 DUF1697 domain-containing protein [Microbacterium sp.]MBN9191288.1 DUF1697 domain-containing protein [Microbacterium sp.]OJU58632.1 MAG: hypothetical protein BGO04_12330 [Microbacterium sp. 70-38]